MMRILADKIASSTKNVNLTREIRVGPEVIAKEGQIVAVRIHGNKSVYNKLENCSGRMVSLHNGDIIVGALGHRDALLGYSGYVPDSVKVGDRLQILNLGGVIGKCTSVNPDVGTPFDAEILGSVLVFPEFENRTGVPANVRMNALKGDPEILKTSPVPVIYVAGTCMNSGKTSAASAMIQILSDHGLAVGACKITGVSLLKDTLEMIDNGASWAYSFVDVGIVTTSAETAVESAQTLISALTKKNPDVIVAELGDGILGTYGVRQVLGDKLVMNPKAALVLCANDPVGAWGAVQLLRDNFGFKIDVISGPTTDNLAGTSFVERELGIKALNARTSGHALGEHILQVIQPALKKKSK